MEEFSNGGQNYYFLKISFVRKYFLAKSLEISNQIIDALQQVQKDFLWNSSSPKMKLFPMIFNIEG